MWLPRILHKRSYGEQVISGTKQLSLSFCWPFWYLKKGSDSLLKQQQQDNNNSKNNARVLVSKARKLESLIKISLHQRSNMRKLQPRVGNRSRVAYFFFSQTSPKVECELLLSRSWKGVPSGRMILYPPTKFFTHYPLSRWFISFPLSTRFTH